ncbi:MAG: hypothetical protein K2P27_07580, partial [Lachnospiraceae bacterium]|nr:hypothetical protein [Lachnospiraceae bacterium]
LSSPLFSIEKPLYATFPHLLIYHIPKWAKKQACFLRIPSEILSNAEQKTGLWHYFPAPKPCLPL